MQQPRSRAACIRFFDLSLSDFLPYDSGISDIYICI